MGALFLYLVASEPKPRREIDQYGIDGDIDALPGREVRGGLHARRHDRSVNEPAAVQIVRDPELRDSPPSVVDVGRRVTARICQHGQNRRCGHAGVLRVGRADPDIWPQLGVAPAKPVLEQKDRRPYLSVGDLAGTRNAAPAANVEFWRHAECQFGGKMVVHHIDRAGECATAVAHVDPAARHAGDLAAFDLGEELVVADFGAPNADRLRRCAAGEASEAE